MEMLLLAKDVAEIQFRQNQKRHKVDLDRGTSCSEQVSAGHFFRRRHSKLQKTRARTAKSEQAILRAKVNQLEIALRQMQAMLLDVQNERQELKNLVPGQEKRPTLLRTKSVSNPIGAFRTTLLLSKTDHCNDDSDYCYEAENEDEDSAFESDDHSVTSGSEVSVSDENKTPTNETASLQPAEVSNQSSSECTADERPHPAPLQRRRRRNRRRPKPKWQPQSHAYPRPPFTCMPAAWPPIAMPFIYPPWLPVSTNWPMVPVLPQNNVAVFCLDPGKSGYSIDTIEEACLLPIPLAIPNMALPFLTTNCAITANRVRLPRRRYTELSKPVSTSNPIYRIASYNVLCQRYCGTKQFPYCPEWALNSDHRSKVLLQQLLNESTHPILFENQSQERCFDIICLQEIESEMHETRFLPTLESFGYEGFFSPKSRARTLTKRERGRVDGCAIFYDKQRFETVETNVMEFSQLAVSVADNSELVLNRVMTKDNVGVAMLLRCLDSPSGRSQYIIVYTVHIHWDPEYSDVKLVQSILLMAELQRLSNYWSNVYEQSSIPLVLCGDLNSLPESGPIQFLSSGRVSATHADFRSHRYDSDLERLGCVSADGNSNDKLFTHSFALSQVDEIEPALYTNYTPSFKGKIDYIFFSKKHFNATSYLGCPDWTFFDCHNIPGLPNEFLPSDHIPLVINLELLQGTT